MQPPQGLDGLAHEPLDEVRAARIHQSREGADAMGLRQFLRQGLHQVHPAGAQGQMAAPGREQPRRGLAETGGGPGDENDGMFGSHGKPPQEEDNENRKDQGRGRRFEALISRRDTLEWMARISGSLRKTRSMNWP